LSRLTEQWTSTSTDAFGASGIKGDRGEQYLANVFTKWGWSYIIHSSDRALQLSGKDISFKKPSWSSYYTADVKNNINSHGDFFIECSPRGWLFASGKTSDRIWHVNDILGFNVWYDRGAMKQYIASKRLAGSSQLLKLNIHHLPKFATFSQQTV
jgi:hypothetical protein